MILKKKSKAPQLQRIYWAAIRVLILHLRLQVRAIND